MQAKIWNHSEWIKETQSKKLREFFDEVLVKCGFHILDVTEHHFKPQGYTCLYLLSESHFAIHTFPEYGKSYIELSSCNMEYYKRFIELTKDL